MTNNDTLAISTGLGTNGSLWNVSEQSAYRNNFTELERLNNLKVIQLFPSIIYTSLLMLIGTPGNGIVLYVYYYKWRKSTSRIFILFLAALDILNCMTTLPVEIYIMRFPLMFDVPWLCKISRFSTYFLNSASAAILVAIAVDRYKKICKPWDKQFSARASKYICIGCIVLASFLTWPALVFYGTRYINLGTVTGTSCLLENDFDTSSYPHIYFVFMMGSTVLVFATLSVLYYFVGLQIYRHGLFKQNSNKKDKAQSRNPPRQRNENSPRLEAYGDIELVQPLNDLEMKCDNNEKKNGPHIADTNNDHIVGENNKAKTEDHAFRQRISRCICECSIVNDNATISNTERTDSERQTNQKTNVLHKQISLHYSSNEPCSNHCVKLNIRVRIGKSTLMLFLITLAYIISFLPYYSLVIIRQSNKSFYGQLSDAGFVAYHLFLRSYQLSSAINPIIYSFCNAQFRMFTLELFRRYRRRSSLKDWT